MPTTEFTCPRCKAEVIIETPRKKHKTGFLHTSTTAQISEVLASFDGKEFMTTFEVSRNPRLKKIMSRRTRVRTNPDSSYRHETRVSSLLSLMVKKGLLSRRGKGVYSLHNT